MRDNLRAFRIWAPDDALWTAWAKPVLFANAAQWRKPEPPAGVVQLAKPEPSAGVVQLAKPALLADVLQTQDSDQVQEAVSLDIPVIDWMPHFANDIAVIADLPGKRGVEEALALARLGFRPVPLYNGVCAPAGAKMLVDAREVLDALFLGTNELSALSICSNAPPVFMLDAMRMLEGKRFGKPGEYDNRWNVLPQDMPSAAYLLQQGIRKVIVRKSSGQIQTDLSHVLCRYQEQKISIMECDDASIPRSITVAKPSAFKSVFYRLGVIVGLRRNSSGGFGAVIPTPSESSGGRG